MKPRILILNGGYGYKEVEGPNVVFHFNDVHTFDEKIKYGGMEFLDVVFLRPPEDSSVINYMKSRIRKPRV